MKHKFKNVDLDLYSYKFSNGLRLFVVPFKNANNIYATFSTKYGSSIDEFKPYNKNKYIKIPAGVAHFLEHKIFEQKNNIDPFTFYTNNGADANANTSNYKTTYLFSGPDKLKENLNYLLDFVQDPYFTDENVLKEKGIIEQEIKMYDDMPFWKLYDTTLNNVFINHPLKKPIAGKVSDIMKINKEILYDCYYTFYNPANMFITVTGNVDPNLVYETVFENQKRKKFNKFKKVSIKKVLEPDNVYLKKEILNLDVKIPKFSLAYKINVKDYDINHLNLCLNTILDCKIGSTSILSDKLFKKGLITENLEYETILADNHIIYIIMGETYEVNKVIKMIKDTLSNLSINEEELERKKKVLKSVVQYRSDNIYAVNSKINNNIIKFNKVILNDYDLIDNLNIDEFEKIINDIDLSNLSEVIVKNT